MSLIHLDKSVLRFHILELMEDGHAGNQLALLGLSAVLLGPKLLPTLARASRPVAKQLVKSGHSYRPRMTLTEWIKQSQGNNLDAGR